MPVAFEWRPDAGASAPWKLAVGKKSDLSDARVEYLDSDVHTNAEGIVSYDADSDLAPNMANWQLGAK